MLAHRLTFLLALAPCAAEHYGIRKPAACIGRSSAAYAASQSLAALIFCVLSVRAWRTRAPNRAIR